MVFRLDERNNKSPSGINKVLEHLLNQAFFFIAPPQREWKYSRIRQSLPRRKFTGVGSNFTRLLLPARVTLCAYDRRIREEFYDPRNTRGYVNNKRTYFSTEHQFNFLMHRNRRKIKETRRGRCCTSSKT